MRKTWLLLIVGLLVTVLALGAVACEDDDDTDTTDQPTASSTEADGEPTEAGDATPTAAATQTGAEAQLCTDLADLDTALDALASALSDPNSSVGSIRTAYDAVAAAWTSGQTSATAVVQERAVAVDTAQADLDAAMTALPDTATRDEAVTAVQPQVDALVTATADALSQIGC